MGRMIDQLLDFSRARLGVGIPVVARSCDLLPLIKQTIDEVDAAHPEGTIRLEHEGDLAGCWELDRLAQVFTNLLANALQHGLVEHGVRVRVNGSSRATVSVEVWNMGVIPAELLPTRLFEPLAGGRGPQSGSRGLGLGLFIAREIVAAHGGTIRVSSIETAGTTFTVELPRVVLQKSRGSPAQSRGVARPFEAPGEPERVAAVESHA